MRFMYWRETGTAKMGKRINDVFCWNSLISHSSSIAAGEPVPWILLDFLSTVILSPLIGFP